MGFARHPHRTPPVNLPTDPPPRSCCHTAAECAAGACGICICCPIATLCCCVRLPFRVSHRVRKTAADASCCGGRRSLSGFSSSFSDIDFEADQAEDRGIPRRLPEKASRASIPLLPWRSCCRFDLS
ncbi:hypothetical protein KFK09_000930 [Dendrobium nobile]|uniref:Uncharacterized protein n=1 Tax=Dendrobium nobile TaxID=94219 RepID=A0A8T3CCF4_DENNO|nr:hypothetical protein KFK09_000930 [Dendrobium nobile]